MAPLKLRTEIEPESRNNCDEISHRTPVMLMGSCFTDNIGAMLADHLFDVAVNPMGILFNPLSIARSLEAVSELNYPGEESQLVVTPDSGLYNCLDFHSDFSAPTPREVFNKCRNAVIETRKFLERATHLILTFGSNHVYIDRTTRQAVANCHRLPASRFEERVLSLDETVCAINRALEAALSINPALNIILTVSPVRHTAYTLHGNLLSKATLLLAIERCIAEAPPSIRSIQYFPSFEILNDDLRDYRFYADDLVHPSPLAIRYIYNHFQQLYMSQETIEFSQKCLSLTNRLRHRHRTAHAEAIARFETSTRQFSQSILSVLPSTTRNHILKNYPQLQQ